MYTRQMLQHRGASLQQIIVKSMHNLHTMFTHANDMHCDMFVHQYLKYQVTRKSIVVSEIEAGIVVLSYSK